VDDDPQDFDFSTTNLTPATFTLDDDGVGPNQRAFAALLPGTYTVTEDADSPGWQLTDIACVGGDPIRPTPAARPPSGWTRRRR
jgi:hypothetical protein